MFDERFESSDLDAAIWTTSYLPAWSSRAETAATYEVSGGALRLSIPPRQGLSCADLHEPPLRVSAVQSGNWSGPPGSTRGQAPFREGLVVREEQPTVLGFTPLYGRIEVTCRATIGPRSMFSAWMIGIEDEPYRCGEICLVEVFGDAIGTDAGEPVVALGCGVHAFRDPRLAEDFATLPLSIDVADEHRYAAVWTPDGVDFLVDDVHVRRSAQSPAYPLQLILGVFDFPDRARVPDAVRTPVPPTPELVVSRVFWEPFGAH
jgi:hypothetical protein